MRSGCNLIISVVSLLCSRDLWNLACDGKTLSVAASVFGSTQDSANDRNAPPKPRVSKDNNAIPHGVPNPKRQSSALNELINLIFGEYHKELVPKKPTVIKLDLLLMKVKSTNEREGIFETVVALFIEWEDHRLVWDPAEYGNTTVLAFDSDKVWLPDIAMTNSADHLYSISKDIRFVVRVSHDGTMKFVPTGTARTWCDLKLITFPFDFQTCRFEFESWSLDSSTMTFNTSSVALVDDAFSSPQWALCQHRSTVYDYFYEFSSETFTRVRFDFVVRRKPTFYIINLIFPTATLSLIQLLVFAIPSTDASSDRVAFGTTNLLTLVVFQTIITEEMPKSSDSVTALSKYIIALIIISALGILESVAAERLLRPTSTPPPSWLVNLQLPLLWHSQLPTGIAQMEMVQWCEGELIDASKPADTQSLNGDSDEHNSEVTKRESNHEPSIVIEYEDDKTNGCCGSSRKRRNARNVQSKVKLLAPSKFKKKGNFAASATSGEDNYERLLEFPPKMTRVSSLATRRPLYQMCERPDSPMAESPEDLYLRLPDFASELQGQLPPEFIEERYHLPHRRFSRKLDFKTVQSQLRRRAFAKRGKVSAFDQPLETGGGSEVALVKIGQAWGAIVTQLDGLTFVICASLAIFLPAALFLPLILIEQSCSSYGSKS